MHRRSDRPEGISYPIRPSDRRGEKSLNWYLTKLYFSYIISHVLKNTALWCSRLARQPVTLEVDGSSPFGVAK